MVYVVLFGELLHWYCAAPKVVAEGAIFKVEVPLTQSWSGEGITAIDDGNTVTLTESMFWQPVVVLFAVAINVIVPAVATLA